MADLHALDPARVGLLGDGRRERFIARQIDLWTRRRRASEDDTIEAMELLIGWLAPRATQGN